MMHRLLSSALMVACTLGAARAQSWTTYHNERFGTTADRPADWSAAPPPDNGDGQEFDSPDGKGRLAISGILTLGEPQRDAQARMQPQSGETIVYKAATRKVVVVSGTKDGGTIFFRKSLLSCGDRVWNDLSLEYPAAEKAAYDDIVAHVAGSLRAGSGIQADDCR